MTIRVAINGYGRIGRMVLRALYEDQLNGKPRRDIQIVAITKPIRMHLLAAALIVWLRERN